MKTKFIKTAVKGLYLTVDGKAWHKLAKREIQPTATGKIRFNGKLYDLQKLTIATKPPSKAKPTIKKVVSIRELQKQGFKKTKISGLYLTKNGLCYNSALNKNLSIRNGKTTINCKVYNVAKIILETFCKIPVRTGQIVFINGNNNDFNFENLEYKSTITQPPPVATDLIKCIRMYFEVKKNFNKKSLLVNYYLSEIIKMRNFNLQHKGIDFDLFLDYYKNSLFSISKNQNAVFKDFNYTAINGKNAINKYLNLLISECLHDYENGLLQLFEFKPKPPTKTQRLKALQQFANENGLNIKIPLRKPSVKEILNKYDKHAKNLNPD